MKSVIHDVITEHLDKHKLIRDSQHGFRRDRSCTTNILEFLHMVRDVINQKGNVDVIFLDFAKAFDKVPHRRLLAKLQSRGIDGWIVRWCVKWHTTRISSLIFINDLEDNIVSVILKFADDTKIFRTVTNATDGLQLQQDVDRLCDCSDRWKLVSTADAMPDCISSPWESWIVGTVCQSQHIQVNSVNCFKNQLDKLRTNQMDFFMDE